MIQYDEGKERYIYDGQSLLTNKLVDDCGNEFPDWLIELGNHFGKHVLDCTNVEYTFKGIMYTDCDYYYILENPVGKTIYESCVGKITIL